MKEFLSMEEVAELAGVQPDTISSYFSRSKGRPPEKRYIPEPDIYVGRTPGWLPETIAKWLASRPGPGTRTDTW